jgi:RNA polymerase sigma factor (TIGR02999 family)
MDDARDPDVTELLQAWGRGGVQARDDLLPLVYRDLQRRAEAHMRRERAGHTLQATALVHEAFLRLIKQDRIAWQNRAQFFGVAAEMMRRILVDRARARQMTKRSGRWLRVTMHDDLALGRGQNIDVIDLDAALKELASIDTRKSQIAEQRFFGGLSLEDTGRLLGVSVATVERDWQAARAWLYVRLTRIPRHDA